MPPPMDALGAFSHLSDNLPSWISRLSDLASHTAARHAEFAESFQKHATVKPRRRKNSSVCSIRTEDLPSSTPNASNPNPRKRPAEDAASFDSGDHPTMANMRHRLIIQYDGHTQKSLEEMVRSIGSARNNIRRGKMAQLPQNGFRMGMFSRSSRLNNTSIPPGLPPDDNAPDDLLLSNIRSARNRRAAPQPRGPVQESPFDLADKQLELAHGLCETAAYQFLRSGDCANELKGVEEKFKILLDLSTKEVQRLQAEQQHKSEEEHADADADDPAAEASSKPSQTSSPPKPAGSNSGAIEVDDGSDSGESLALDLSAFRSTRMMRA